MRATDDRPYHWQDRWAQLLLGANPQDRANLVLLRNAEVMMGLVFGQGYVSGDDGGYLAQRLTAYAASGRLTL